MTVSNLEIKHRFIIGILILLISFFTITTSFSTVSNIETRKIYNGTGSLLIFPYTWKIYAETDLNVWLTDLNGLHTAQVLNIDYTVSGVGGAGGNVTFSVAPAATSHVAIAINLPLTQETDYVELDAFPAQSHEDALDRLVKISQGLDGKLGRVPLLPEASPITSLPMPENLTGLPAYLRWNAAGSALEASPVAPTTNFNLLWIPVASYGSVLNGTALSAALAANPGGGSLYFGGPCAITTPITIPSGFTIADGLYQIFSCTGTGKVVFEAGAVVQVVPQWFAASVDNGSTDASIPINQAIVAANGVIPVYLPIPAVNYYIPNTARIDLLSGTTLKGDNSEIHFQAKTAYTGAGSIYGLSKTNITIDGLYLTSAATTTRYHNGETNFDTAADEAQIYGHTVSKTSLTSFVLGIHISGSTNTTIKNIKANYIHTIITITGTGNSNVNISDVSGTNIASMGVYAQASGGNIQNVTLTDIGQCRFDAALYYRSSTDMYVNNYKVYNLIGQGLTMANATAGAGVVPLNNVVFNNIYVDGGVWGVWISSDAQGATNISFNHVTMINSLYRAVELHSGAKYIKNITFNDLNIGSPGPVCTGIFRLDGVDTCKIKHSLFHDIDTASVFVVGDYANANVQIDGVQFNNCMGSSILSTGSTAIAGLQVRNSDWYWDTVTAYAMYMTGTVTGSLDNLTFTSGTNEARNALSIASPSAMIVSNCSVKNLTGVGSTSGILRPGTSGVTGAIASGATVTHGLGTTPTKVLLTSVDGVPTAVYPGTFGATTFVINYTGGGTHAFYWEAIQ